MDSSRLDAKLMHCVGRKCVKVNGPTYTCSHLPSSTLDQFSRPSNNVVGQVCIQTVDLGDEIVSTERHKCRKLNFDSLEDLAIGNIVVGKAQKRHKRNVRLVKKYLFKKGNVVNLGASSRTLTPVEIDFLDSWKKKTQNCPRIAAAFTVLPITFPSIYRQYPYVLCFECLGN
ncbi:hypothetical protein K1719_010472 [Acacia pycnantha]|nr:hypothetical protein K1719_010472 [Acacia pycnantha]